ncbi:hypothetical protein [Nannocystis pusilla]|uniref:Uncharacterized protein n=1 Tax=Nannocystis pusilla TaxID=889268 RepID=A0ABS7TP46_9BACT|nr:hypothetical protein [Nannocystis pusilla]MBZ5710007.1 hypothetical protein [Nannocystis pusilla]
MRAAAQRLGDAAGAARRALRRYDRHFLVCHLELWQTRAHWIAPVSLATCLAGAAIVELSRIDADAPVRSLDALVSPLVFASVLVIVLWVRDQRGVLVSFAAPSRRWIASLALLRLLCAVAVLLPSVVVDAGLRARAVRIAAAAENVGVATAIVHASERCLAEPSADAPPIARLRERASRLVEAARTRERGDAASRPARASWPAAARSERWIGVHCHDAAASSPNEDIRRIEQLHLYAIERVFPRPSLRALMYLLTCGAVVVPFLALWAGARRIAVRPAIWLGLFFVVHSLTAVGWVPGGWLARGPWVWSLLVVSVVAIVGAPLAAWRKAPPQLVLFTFATALIVAPLLPVAALWLSAPASGDDPGFVCLGLPSFMAAGQEGIDWRELAAYAAGLAYCCIYVVAVGPTMHRMWAAPR